MKTLLLGSITRNLNIKNRWEQRCSMERRERKMSCLWSTLKFPLPTMHLPRTVVWVIIRWLHQRPKKINFCKTFEAPQQNTDISWQVAAFFLCVGCWGKTSWAIFSSFEQNMQWASLVAQSVKNLPAVQETWVQSLDREDSPGDENGNPRQNPCLENPKDRGAWQATVPGVAKGKTELSD